MCLKRLMGFFGRLFGQILSFAWNKGWKLAFWIAVALVFLFGIILAFVGNIIVLVLGFILALLVYALKGFAWFTYHFMCTTQWVSGKVSDYTESFFDGVASVFKQEEENLEKEIRLIIRTENM